MTRRAAAAAVEPAHFVDRALGPLDPAQRENRCFPYLDGWLMQLPRFDVIFVAQRSIAYWGGREGTEAPAGVVALLLPTPPWAPAPVSRPPLLNSVDEEDDVDEGRADSDRTQKDDDRQADGASEEEEEEEEDDVVLVDTKVRLTTTKSAVDKSPLLGGVSVSEEPLLDEESSEEETGNASGSTREPRITFGSGIEGCVGDTTPGASLGSASADVCRHEVSLASSRIHLPLTGAPRREPGFDRRADVECRRRGLASPPAAPDRSGTVERGDTESPSISSSSRRSSPSLPQTKCDRASSGSASQTLRPASMGEEKGGGGAKRETTGGGGERGGGWVGREEGGGIGRRELRDVGRTTTVARRGEAKLSGRKAGTINGGTTQTTRVRLRGSFEHLRR